MPTIRVILTAVCVLALMAKATTSFANPAPAVYLKNPDGGAIRALIIGIDAYQHVRPLKGSVADARDIEGALRSMGKAPTQAGSLRLPLRVREPFGAEQVVAITSTQRQLDLEQAVLQLNQRKAPGQLIKVVAKYLPPDARVGSIGFFTVP
jgi:hypothetical protein